MKYEIFWKHSIVDAESKEEALEEAIKLRNENRMPKVSGIFELENLSETSTEDGE